MIRLTQVESACAYAPPLMDVVAALAIIYGIILVAFRTFYED